MNETESKPTEPFENIVVPPKKARVKTPRFTNREQIIARIDKFTAKAKRQRQSQSECYAKAGTLRRHQENAGYHEELHQATLLDHKGDSSGRKADRLEKDVLPKLKQKLAEFDTETLPGVDVDRSIPGI